MRWAELPDGTFVLGGSTDSATAPVLVLGDEIVEWGTAGYGGRRPRPSGLAQVITPPSTVAALRAGYPVRIDPSARRMSQPGAPARLPGNTF